MGQTEKTDNQYDVVVVGGGPSGAVAGIAAARCGARTLVIEQHGFLGGSLTAMGVGPMMSFHNPSGQQVVAGIAQELVDRLQARGASPGHIPDAITYCNTITPFDAEALKGELDAMLLESGGRPLFHTQLATVHRVGNEIAGITVCTESGLMDVAGAQYIDATGNACLAFQAGAECWTGRESDGATQPMTMKFKVGNVDTAALRAYIEDHPEDFSFKEGAEEGLRRLRQSPCVNAGGFFTAWRAAKEAGEIDVPRDDVLFFETATPGEIIVNTSRIHGLDPTDPWALSEAEILGRRQAMEIFGFLRQHCAGFGKAHLLGTPAHVGIRETRHVRARYMIEGEDVLEQREFPDSVAQGGYPIDIHSPDGGDTKSQHLPRNAVYRIPLRSLIPTEPDNLVLVGRHIGATHEAAAAFRVTPIVMAIGQAGGVTAALAAKAGTPPGSVPAEEVRERLLSENALI